MYIYIYNIVGMTCRAGAQMLSGTAYQKMGLGTMSAMISGQKHIHSRAIAVVEHV